MVKFGTLKSKIEKKLLESYNSNNFKSEIKNFRDCVLSNKKVSKLFYLYDELNSNKGLNESESKDFISESLNLIKQIRLTESDIIKVKKWTNKIRSTNEYKTIDDLLSENLDVKKIVTLKSKLVETLRQSEIKEKNNINIPINSMINVANQTLGKHLETLTESERKEFEGIVKMSDKELIKNFKSINEEITSKLKNHLNESTDEDSKKKINDTLDVIKNKEINRLELFKLINLNNSL
jgi:hypothetical protein